ncbi:cytochrome c oxidase subunit 3 [Hymenobacter jeollabukensis]|uniref:Cytochrome oxidase subunit III n=1 Tax=Hymenobacter jeollabukensis TaxID=2025313 RepID=A0A5R8WQG1_9BACT|nr:cytochrome c oxidase subunit 3 [Hymenobacter jeollabukensis]TLM92475.1 cytochrome oxidase subunit III [Hymenobacter jeollabukensis]
MHPSETLNNKQVALNVHPLRFLLWLMIISITMMFAAFTSAYIVRRGEGNWLEFDMPAGMLINTVIILLSSATIQWAWFSARKDEIGRAKMLLVVTFALGVAFLIGQYQVWGELVQNKIFFGGADSNPAGSFVYVLTGVHGFHLVTGLIFLTILLVKAFRYKIHSRQMMAMTNGTIYWHFLGGLWLYLYLFLLLNH